MNRLAAIRPFARCYTTTAVKPNIKLLKDLRKETEVSMSKAKEALVKTNNDYTKALAWLSEDAQISGAKKAQKVSGRIAGEGLITTASVEVPVANGFKSTIIELNCETDFVSKNDVFKNLASRIAATSLLMHDTLGTSRAIETVNVESLLNAPLMPHPSQTELNGDDLSKTVQENIIETIGKLGENISLRRAAIVSQGLSASYIHGGDGLSGKIGGLAVLQPTKVTLAELDPTAAATLQKTARQIARQVVGFNPLYLNTSDVPQTVLDEQTNKEEFEESAVLNKQKYLLKPELTIAEYVEQAADGAHVVDFIRWEVGEGIEKKETDFADEVNQAVNGN